MRTDVYEKITNQIVLELERGVRPWHQPWKAEHAAGRITQPWRGNPLPRPRDMARPAAFLAAIGSGATTSCL